MHVQIKSFSSQKSGGLGNEDACATNPAQGLFAIADGAGSGTSFRSGDWAHTLVKHFMTLPLNSSDPFEVDWWLKGVQNRYSASTEALAHNDWKVQQAVKQGAASTFTAMRIDSIRRSVIQARMFAIGDSCVFISSAPEVVTAFPLTDKAEFSNSPACLPSRPHKFQRDAQRLAEGHIRLPAGSTIILATDAVSAWILSHEEGKARWEAFRTLAEMTTESAWEAFLASCREHRAMSDDDSTIVVVQFTRKKVGEKVGRAPAYTQQVLEERRQVLLKAIEAGDQEQIAIFFGDGLSFRKGRGKGRVPFSQTQIGNARAVARAIAEIRGLARASSLQVQQAWQKHEPLLRRSENRASAEKLLALLQRKNLLQGVRLPPPDASILREESVVQSRLQWLLSLLHLAGEG